MRGLVDIIGMHTTGEARRAMSSKLNKIATSGPARQSAWAEDPLRSQAVR